MIKYLKKDGRNWHIAELILKEENLIFNFKNNYMATTTRCIKSVNGFHKLKNN